MDILCNKKVIIPEARSCLSLLQRLQGYMFSKKPAYTALVFPDCTGLHMFFCFFSLLIIVLNKDQVVEELYILKPWQLGPLYWPGKLLVETPKLELLNEIKPGDTLEFQPKL